MKSEIKLFNNPAFGDIRISLNESNEPLFCLADVCKATGLLNPSSVKQRLDDEDVQLVDLHALNSTYPMKGNTMTNFVTESGFYDVLLQSSSPKVRPFRKWVTSEVLPSIRKSGGYMVSFEDDTPEMIMARALQVAQQTIDNHKQRVQALESEKKEQEKLIAEQKPKVVFAESVMGASNLVLIRDFAKSLCNEDFKIGQNRLYAWFRENGILNSKNEPYQNYVERGYFEVITRVIGSGEATFTSNTTKITGAGQVYFAKKIRDTFKQE